MGSDEDSEAALPETESLAQSSTGFDQLGASGRGSSIPFVHRSMLDGISEIFVLFDRDFRIVDVNREAMRLVSQPREAIIGTVYWDAFPGDRPSELGQVYRKAMRDRVPATLEHRYEWYDGHVSWQSTRVYPVDDGGLAILSRDVSERREQERQLRASEARFRAAIDAIHGVLWTNDASGRMVGDQPAWSALTGQTRDAYEGYGWSQAVHPDDAQPTIDAWKLAVAEKRPFTFEHRVRRHDGVWRRFAIRAIPVLDDDSAIREWVGIHTDITESRATETRFRQLAENINDVFYVIEADDERITYISPAYERVWRRSVNELYNDRFAYFDTVHPEDRARLRLAIEQRRAGCDTDLEYRLLFDDGTVTHIRDRSYITTDPDTGKLRVVGIAEDITAAVEALKRQDMLMREIDHRVRNSLAIVGGLLSMQARTAASHETSVALLSASSRVSAIARIHERLYQTSNLEIVEFGEYISDLCQDLAATAGHDGLTFDCQATSLNIPVDQAVPLGLIATELITNACKYGGVAGPAEVIVRLTGTAAQLTLSVSDTGPGVSDTFNPEGRDGLGMQVITALVKQLHGTIILPEPGRKAEFVVTVPLSPESKA